jgi:hypothetical protein
MTESNDEPDPREELRQIIDRIQSEVVKGLPNAAHKISKAAIANLVGMGNKGAVASLQSDTWKETDTADATKKPPVSPEHAQGYCKNAAWLLEVLEFTNYRKISANGKKPEFAPWVGKPLDHNSEKELVGSEIVELVKKARRDTKPLPVFYVSPAYLGNVFQILSDVRVEMNQDSDVPLSITDLIGAVILKTINPALASFLQNLGLMHRNRNLYLDHARTIADMAKCQFSEELTTQQTQWLRVESYWPALPPFHGLYVEGCDWIHVGPWMPDVGTGELKAWVITNYRIKAESANFHFNYFKNALLRRDEKQRDWSQLAIERGGPGSPKV